METTNKTQGADEVEKLLDERKVADVLGVSIGTLGRWRREGGGPAFIQVADKSVRYAPSDLKQWIADRKRTKRESN